MLLSMTTMIRKQNKTKTLTNILKQAFNWNIHTVATCFIFSRRIGFGLRIFGSLRFLHSSQSAVRFLWIFTSQKYNKRRLFATEFPKRKNIHFLQFLLTVTIPSTKLNLSYPFSKRSSFVVCPLSLCPDFKIDFCMKKLVKKKKNVTIKFFITSSGASSTSIFSGSAFSAISTSAWSLCEGNSLSFVESASICSFSSPSPEVVAFVSDLDCGAVEAAIGFGKTSLASSSDFW